MTVAPVAVALDAPDLTTLERWASAVGPYVSTVKVGLETYLRDGSQAVAAARRGAPNAGLFLDLKLHDIPATVAGAAHAVSALRPDLLTVHASGGAAMIAAAAEALPDTRIVAVTVLTSLTAGDLGAMGLLPSSADTADVRALAVRLAVEATGAGAGAVVCSPQEVADIRAALAGNGGARRVMI